MAFRAMWVDRIAQAWSTRSIVWLSGVRRVGKTTLSKMIGDNRVLYRNCDLPSVVRELRDPELFFDSLTDTMVVVFDEVHQLDDPSQLLKIAADEYPRVKVLATGSSTLSATKKFKDSLTGRKYPIHLTSVLWEECKNTFGIADLDRRLLHGGLPEALLSEEKPNEFFSEWVDSFYARDIAELFHLRNRTGFMALFHLLLHQSGGQLDYTKLSKETELSRPTVISYVDALNVSHAIHVIAPLHGAGTQEIVRRPKCYAFDTGFITWERGWDTLRDSERDLLWEHLVLDSLRFNYPADRVFYWRDKTGREIDFVIQRSRHKIDVFECKMNPDSVVVDSIRQFRSLYAEGENFVIGPFVKQKYRFSRDGIVLNVSPLNQLCVSEDTIR